MDFHPAGVGFLDYMRYVNDPSLLDIDLASAKVR